MKYFYIIMVFLVLTGCNHRQQNGNIKSASIEDNDSILVTYYCGIVNTNVATRCEKLATIQQRHPKNHYYAIVDGKLEPWPINLIDTFIVDSAIIKRIIGLLDNSVRRADDFDEDARMYVTIKRSNDYLCFDHFPYRVKYNGQACWMDKELLFLLRYYSGYYSWFDKEVLDWFEELRDMVLYQKALEQIKLNKFTFETHQSMRKN